MSVGSVSVEGADGTECADRFCSNVCVFWLWWLCLLRCCIRYQVDWYVVLSWLKVHWQIGCLMCCGAACLS